MVPKGIDVAHVVQAVKSVPRVIGVDDVHIWAIRSDYNALSCHIVIDDVHIAESPMIVSEVKDILNSRYDIKHTTIEVELKHCTTQDSHQSH